MPEPDETVPDAQRRREKRDGQIAGIIIAITLISLAFWFLFILFGVSFLLPLGKPTVPIMEAALHRELPVGSEASAVESWFRYRSIDFTYNPDIMAPADRKSVFVGVIYNISGSIVGTENLVIYVFVAADGRVSGYRVTRER